MLSGTTVLPGQIRMHRKRTELVWETLTKHPTVMAQPTAEHQKIRFLRAHRGTMLIGYGDWNNNLGPVNVIGYDLNAKTPVTLLTNVMSEAFDRVRIIDGDAYLPWTDPKTYAGNQGGFTTDRSGVWADVKVGPGDSMVHSFDIIKIGGKIHVSGSRTGSAVDLGVGVVWREDGPGVWTEALRSANEHSFARFYDFRIVNGKYRVQNVAGGAVETFETVDGSSWYPVAGEAWTSQVSWGADSSDPPAALPDGYTSHGVGLVTAVAYHDGWVWVGGESGAVKRARVPDAAPDYLDATFSENF